MNRLKTKVKDIECEGELAKVTLSFADIEFTSLVIDIESSMNLHKSQEVNILFKEMEVLIANKEASVSASNAFVSKISKIEKGKLISKIVFDFYDQKIVSIITTASLQRLNLAQDLDFLWFVKANEITLQRCENV